MTKIAQNTFYLILGRICGGLIHLLIIALLARYLGVTPYGQYIFAITYLAIFNIISGFGIDTILIREISRDKLNSSKLLGCGMMIKAFFSLVSLVLAITIVLFLNLPVDTDKVIYVLSLSLVFVAFQSPRVIFEVYLKSQYLVLTDFITKLTTLSFVYVAMLSNFRLTGIAVVFLLSEFIGLIVLTVLSRRFIHPVFTWDKKVIKSLMQEAWPVALMALLVVIYFRIDTIMLSFMKGDEAVGYYSCAYMIMTSLMLIPDAYVKSIFPVMSDYFKTRPAYLATTFARSLKYLFTAALLVVCAGVMLSEQIIDFVFGDSFHPSARALQILIFAGGIIFVSNLVSMSLTAMNRQRINTWLAFANVIANIILNLILIPRWSYIGASIATVITEGLGCFLAFLFNMTHLKIPLFSFNYLRYTRLFIAGGVTILIIRSLHGMHVLVVLPISTLGYALSLLLLRWFDNEDKQIFDRLIRG